MISRNRTSRTSTSAAAQDKYGVDRSDLACLGGTDNRKGAGNTQTIKTGVWQGDTASVKENGEGSKNNQ